MRHSSVIFAALILAFFVYVTVRGELRQYLKVLGVA